MKNRRILIVDNNDELRASLERALSELGHEVLATGDRDVALEREDLDEFDFIISDLTEEPENTPQMLSETKRKRLLVPIALAANETQQPQIIKAFKIAAANFLRTP